jgi:hypothetical protein
MSDGDGLEARLEEHIKRARRKIEAAELGDGGHEILRLAKLSTIEYDQERQAKADKLGIRVSALDSVVKAERKKFAKEQRDFLPHWNVEPWPEAINGSALLEELRRHFKGYVVLPEHADIALALWVLHT